MANNKSIRSEKSMNTRAVRKIYQLIDRHVKHWFAQAKYAPFSLYKNKIFEVTRYTFLENKDLRLKILLAYPDILIQERLQ